MKPGAVQSKADANAYLSNIETDLGRGEWIDPNAGKITFRQYAERWRAGQIHHRPGTASQIETNLRRHVYPFFGDRPLQAIRPSDVQAWLKVLSEGRGDRKALAPATVEVVFAWVASIFKAAVSDRVIARSPCQKAKRPVVTRERVEPLSTKTVKALIDAAPDRYRALIVLGAGTGVRISEALGLTNDRVLWLDRRVKIDRQLTRVSDGDEPVFGPVKDRRNRPRTIPLPEIVVDELSAHVARYGLGEDDLLFTSASGGPVKTSTFSELWRKMAEPLGIPTGVGFHALRHYYASLLIRRGSPSRRCRIASATRQRR